uniref:ATP-dependent Clp protease proteolytic subunit n=1 Tax=Aldrovanda vesiculosa TaxID=173386 RepID=A0A385KN76_9CARY|nr:ClpP [Aldrovanda vesiculosa]
MPLGLPRIAIRLPGKMNPGWIDLFNGLSRVRVLFLAHDLLEERANSIMGLLVFLSIENAEAEIFLFINSPGGLLILGAGIYYIMNSVPPEINTICIGIAASAASYILSGGEKTKRLAFPHARVMLHQPACDLAYDIQAEEFYKDVQEIIELREQITHTYVEQTGQPRWLISDMLERDVFMSATEAQTLGIVDTVADKVSFQRIQQKIKEYLDENVKKEKDKKNKKQTKRKKNEIKVNGYKVNGNGGFLFD